MDDFKDSYCFVDYWYISLFFIWFKSENKSSQNALFPSVAFYFCFHIISISGIRKKQNNNNNNNNPTF